MRETPQQLETRSQRQAACALATYRWIAKLEMDRPADEALVFEIHRRIVSGCDDDHCPPGRLRGRDDNVTFGTPVIAASKAETIAKLRCGSYARRRGPFFGITIH